MRFAHTVKMDHQEELRAGRDNVKNLGIQLQGIGTAEDVLAAVD